MVAGNTRILKFSAYDLANEITLMLMFTPPPVGKAYHDIFPICWKVITLKKGESTSATVVYTANTAFLSPQLDSGNRVSASSSALCGTGQECTIIEDRTVTKAVKGEDGYLKCTNKSKFSSDIAVGFSNNKGGDVEPAILWKKVAVDSWVKAQFTPFLEIYASTDYQETQMLKGEVGSPLIWKKNLQLLDTTTNYMVSVDGDTGKIIIA